MTKEISIGLFNYKNGGRTASNGYEFTKLQQAFEPVKKEAPDIILINEAKGWKADGHTVLHMAVNALSEKLRRPYVGETGYGIRGDATTPALIYDPQVVRLDFWGDESAANEDKRNFAKMHLLGNSAAKFCISIQHWHPDDGSLRITEAHQTKAIASGPPTLLGGDLNNAASGPHVDMNWSLASDRMRTTKAILQPDGTYVADTSAMDLMLGDWDPTNRHRTKHVRALARQAIGWHALAELAHQSGTSAEEAFKPTVNRGPEQGGGLLIDWLLVNNAWQEGLVAGTYRVHSPSGKPETFPSDHRLVTASLKL